MCCGTPALPFARDAGARPEDVWEQLGHADARTTRRYDHGGQRLDRVPAYTLAAYLTASVGRTAGPGVGD
ncbi:hypothetical protein [Micromonospora carbonacea]|uniref:hypothetical protein n=1 Tax=Micromonospora carbonacea TaxID=47853 RepID=UPI003716525A